jgi:hypothetical protein
MNHFTPGQRGTMHYLNQRVRVNHPESIFHGLQGTIVGKGRYGHWILQMDKDGLLPEIASGHLEPVQEETSC